MKKLPLFLLLALLWSGSFLNIKIVVATMPPIFCALIRVFFSLLTISAIFLAMRKPVFKPKSEYKNIWIAGLFTQAIPFALLFYGEQFIAPALASIINSTVAIWGLILGTILFRDVKEWTSTKLIGIALGFLGIVIVFAPFLHGKESSLIGITAIMGMSISYAIGSLINQHIIFKTMKVKFETNMLQQHVSSVLFLTCLSLSLETWPPLSMVLQTKFLLAFLYLGVVATAIAWMIYFYLIREWGAVRTTSVMYIVPMLAILWDALFLHLIPTTSEVIGMLIIMSGVTLIQWVKKTGTELTTKPA